MNIDESIFKGHLVVVMGPMGSGKGTLIKLAREQNPDLEKTISCTTRKKRPGEVDDVNYHFLTDDQFQTYINNGDFLEWAEFAGHKYGTLKNEIIPRISDSRVVIVEIELQGVEQLLNLLPREHMTIVYIDAGEWKILQKRAKARAPMSDEEMEARHSRFVIEQGAKPLADVVIDNSESLEKSEQVFMKVIESAYKKCKV